MDLTEESRRRCRCGTVLVDDSGGEAWLDYVLARREQDWNVAMRRFERVVNDKLDQAYKDILAILRKHGIV